MVLRLETAVTVEIGVTPHGTLSIFPVTGGTFEGERLRGKVLAGGGDWAWSDDANHYLRTLPRFETAAPKYAFLNRLLAVGIGEIGPEGPVHTIEEIL
jgi:hypothetical protein